MRVKEEYLPGCCSRCGDPALVDLCEFCQNELERMDEYEFV